MPSLEALDNLLARFSLIYASSTTPLLSSGCRYVVRIILP